MLQQRDRLQFKTLIKSREISSSSDFFYTEGKPATAKTTTAQSRAA